MIVHPMAAGILSQSNIKKNTIGQYWTTQTVGIDPTSSVSFANNNFYVTTAGTTTNPTKIYISHSGQTWEQITDIQLVTSPIVKIAYGNGIYIGLLSSGRNIVASVDGLSWITVPNVFPQSFTGYDLIFANGNFLFCGASNAGNIYIGKNTNDIVALQNPQTTAFFRSILYANGYYVFASYSQRLATPVMTTFDLSNWNLISMQPQTTGYNALAYGNGRSIVFPSSSPSTTVPYYATYNGVDWLAIQTGVFSSSIRAVIWIEDHFVAVQNRNYCYHSKEDLVWTRFAFPTLGNTSASSICMAYGNDTLIAVSSTGGGSNNVIGISRPQ